MTRAFEGEDWEAEITRAFEGEAWEEEMTRVFERENWEAEMIWGFEGDGTVETTCEAWEAEITRVFEVKPERQKWHEPWTLEHTRQKSRDALKANLERRRLHYV